MLTDSYEITEDGCVSLSGESRGAQGITKKIIHTLKGGETVVLFKPIDEHARKLVTDKLKKSYVENAEGYIVEVSDKVFVYADSDRAKLFAACAIKDKYIGGKIQKGIWWSYPCVPHRSLRMFLPPKDKKEYFFNLIDMLVHLGYNSILLEIGGAMEFKNHPEINEGWLKYCASVNEDIEKYNLVKRGYYRTKNSVHTYNAGGDVYSQREIKEIADYCRERFVEIIPEVPSLSHSEYLCVSHPELRECLDEPYASTACPSNPKLNEIVFELYDEVIDVLGCKSLHIGHDEWWVMCVCEKCKGKSPVDLYTDNVMQSYNYLKSKGIKTYMWSDKMHRITDKEGECHGAAYKDVYSIPTKSEPKTLNIMGVDYPLYDRYWYNAPDWVKKEGFHQKILEMGGCSKRLPADIMYCNWYYACDPDIADNVFYREGKDMIIGNALASTMNNYKQRFKYGAKGISVSSWTETEELNMQEWGVLFELGYGSIICYNHDRDELDHERNVFDVFGALYNYKNKDVLAKPHIEVKHSVVKNWDEGKKYYGKMAKIDKEFLTLGHYKITYKDKRTENFPVVFTINISSNKASIHRCANKLNWDYYIDPDIPRTASVCDISQEEDGLWYKTVIPISGDAEKCEYFPKPGYEDFVSVKNIEIK